MNTCWSTRLRVEATLPKLASSHPSDFLRDDEPRRSRPRRVHAGQRGNSYAPHSGRSRYHVYLHSPPAESVVTAAATAISMASTK